MFYYLNVCYLYNVFLNIMHHATFETLTSPVGSANDLLPTNQEGRV